LFLLFNWFSQGNDCANAPALVTQNVSAQGNVQMVDISTATVENGCIPGVAQNAACVAGFAPNEDVVPGGVAQNSGKMPRIAQNVNGTPCDAQNAGGVPANAQNVGVILGIEQNVNCAPGVAQIGGQLPCGARHADCAHASEDMDMEHYFKDLKKLDDLQDVRTY